MEVAPVVEVAAPVVPPVEPTQEVSGTEPPAGTEAAPPTEAGKDEPKPETKAERLLSQEEVNRIVRRERRAAEERAYSRALKDAEIERLRAEVAAARGETPTGQKGNGDAEPRPDQFKDWDTYNRALVRWEIQQATRQESQGKQRQTAQAEEAEYAATVQAKLAVGEEKYEDFREVVTDPRVAFTPPMIKAMLGTSAPHDVAYYLGQHPKDSHRIAALDLADQVREIDKIAATLTKPPAPTSAPAPIKPNSGSGGVEKTLETAGNYKEWVKIRERQLAQKS